MITDKANGINCMIGRKEGKKMHVYC